MKRSFSIVALLLVVAASYAVYVGRNSTASLLHVAGSGSLRMHSGSGSFRRTGSGGFAHGPSALSQRLGISDEQIRAEIKAGKTIQEIAKEHGVTLPDPLQQLADRLHISKTELQSEMKGGKPLMQILKEHGLKTPQPSQSSLHSSARSR